jgi:peptide/nickel transport system ATP-binding protein
MADTVLEVRDLSLEYRSRRGPVKALRGVSFDLYKGETLALIGESGCGKSTMGFALIRLTPGTAKITNGNVTFVDGPNRINLMEMSENEIRRFRWTDMAMMLQAALNAYNPLIRIQDHFIDTAKAHGLTNKTEIIARARRLLTGVQLDADRVLPAYPHELSGGMRQRVLLALGLLMQPKIIILDEPTTALDILTQRSIIDLLRKLKDEFNFTMIFISHDLSLAAELADRVATMYAGQIVELTDVFSAFEKPRHPYTFGLTRAVPTLHGAAEKLESIPGSPPDLVFMPSGCKFHPRCPFATDKCKEVEPKLTAYGTHQVACHNWQQVLEESQKAR